MVCLFSIFEPAIPFFQSVTTGVRGIDKLLEVPVEPLGPIMVVLLLMVKCVSCLTFLLSKYH